MSAQVMAQWRLSSDSRYGFSATGTMGLPHKPQSEDTFEAVAPSRDFGPLAQPLIQLHS
jgi:hypothetical protein